MNAGKLFSLIRLTKPYTGQDVRITIADLFRLSPEISHEQIADTLVNLPGVRVIDERSGGIIIPAKYFEGNEQSDPNVLK